MFDPTEIGAALLHLFKMAQIPFGPKDGKAIARGMPSKPERLESRKPARMRESFQGISGNFLRPTRPLHCATTKSSRDGERVVGTGQESDNAEH